MGKADRYIEKYKGQHSQLKPFKNRPTRYLDFVEMMEHSKNESNFMSKIINKKNK